MNANYYRFLIARLAIVRDLHRLAQAILDDAELSSGEKFDLGVLIGVKLDRHTPKTRQRPIRLAAAR